MKGELQDFVDKYHGGRFDLTKFEYTGAKQKSVVICKEHGEFLISPQDLKRSKYACPECVKMYKSYKNIKGGSEGVNKETYLKLFQDLHGTSYVVNLEKYKSKTQGLVTITCEKHGDTTKNPINFLNVKHACNKCSNEGRSLTKTKSFDNFMKDANLLYGDRYTYDEKSYVNRNSIIEITCKIHGKFKKKAQKHLSGQGCFRCKIAELKSKGILVGGYSLEYFNSYPENKNKPASVYYLKVGDFYKIGISTNIRNRIKSIKNASKEDVVIISKYDSNLYECFEIEQKILEKYKEFRIDVGWSTEVFCKDVLNGGKFI